MTEPITRQQLSTASLDDLAYLLGLNGKQLAYWSYAAPSSKKYTEFAIPKRSVGMRQISAPIGVYKGILIRLARILTSIYEPSNPVHGFVSGRSIITNATQHKGRKFVLNVDLEDFFPSINFGRVRGLLCARCNSGLAKFMDSITSLRRAVRYMKDDGAKVAKILDE